MQSMQSMPMNPHLSLENLTFTYPNGHKAVDDVSVTLRTGIVGLLGPNGAGKTSLMAVLATLTKATSGRASWGDIDIAKHPNAIRAVLGYLPQHFGIYPALSAAEFLHYLAAVKGMPSAVAKQRVAYCLDMVGLGDVAGQRLGGFSGGMRQRVGIAQALLNEPQLLIVDEPTVGLDPEERLRFRLLLAELAQQRLVILSTHIVSDIEASASSIAIMAKGQLRFHDSSEALIGLATGNVWEWLIPSQQLAAVRATYVLSSTIACADGMRVRIVAPSAPDVGALAVTPTLEDAYLHVLNSAGAA
jgi:ABC-2 type transport system ATP-binding protein